MNIEEIICIVCIIIFIITTPFIIADMIKDAIRNHKDYWS